MWPIRDLSGDVIAFGARKLDPDDDGPKYLNTPETPLFRKSTVLYGADLARRGIAQRRQAVIVEGYTDVMACHLAGVHRGGDVRHLVRRGARQGAPQAPHGHRPGARRIDLYLRRRRSQAAGGAERAFALEERFVTQTFVTCSRKALIRATCGCRTVTPRCVT